MRLNVFWGSGFLKGESGHDSLLMLGWAQAFFTVLVLWGVNNVFSRYSATVLEVNPIIYSCTAFSSCAFVLLLRGGYGPLAKETMRSVDTWLYGFILMLNYILGIMLFSYVTSTQGTMLQRVTVAVALLGSWFFLGRKPDIFQIIGTLTIVCGILVVAVGIESEHVGLIYLLALAHGALQAARIFVAELHRPHSKAADDNNPKAQARVVGFVMFVISLMFLVGTLLVALMQEIQPEHAIAGLPRLSDFFFAPTILAGLVGGVLIVAPLRVFEFASTHIIKTENFTMVTSLSFISTLFWEFSTSPLTGLSVKEISGLDIAAGLLITAGGLLIALTRKWAKKPSQDAWKSHLVVSSQDVEVVEESRELVASALEHFNGRVKDAATALGVPTTVLKAMLEDRERVLAFKPDVYKRVVRLYRKNVTMGDALTGAVNRTGMMRALKAAIYQQTPFNLYYIDLDKFKPVNDTHGHAAGDAILQGVAMRLKALFPKQATVARMGGDEFCVLLVGTRKERAPYKREAILACLQRPFYYQKNKICIGASVGVARFPHDGDDAEELIKRADEAMYDDKKNA